MTGRLPTRSTAATQTQTAGRAKNQVTAARVHAVAPHHGIELFQRSIIKPGRLIPLQCNRPLRQHLISTQAVQHAAAQRVQADRIPAIRRNRSLHDHRRPPLLAQPPSQRHARDTRTNQHAHTRRMGTPLAISTIPAATTFVAGTVNLR